MTNPSAARAGDPGARLESLLSAHGLDPSISKELATLEHRTVEADTRRVFRDSGDPRDAGMVVMSGLMSKFQSDGSGRRQIVALLFPGDTILPAKHDAAYGLQAITKSELVTFTRKSLDDLADRSGIIANWLRNVAQREASIAQQWLSNIGRKDSTARVAHLLCETAHRSGVDVQDEPMSLPFTQQQIADMTGQTSVNVNRVFAYLEKQGVIARSGRTLTVKDAGELRRTGSFNPDYLA